mgnify:CR=1 FL=1
MSQPSKARVLTIVLNYRTPELTLRSVEAALREMEGLEGGITVVDNDSGDGSFEKLTQAVRERGWNRVLQAPILVATFMFGPLGLLLFYLTRATETELSPRKA